MARFNLKSIFSRVDSHIIDYPTAMIFFLNIPVVLVMFLLSPVHSSIFLVVICLRLIQKGHYSFCLRVTLFYLLVWYIILIICLFGYDNPIMIRPDFIGCGEKTRDSIGLFFFIVDEYLDPVEGCSILGILLGDFCMVTIILLSKLSSKIGVGIYIPSILKGIIAILKKFGK